MILNAERYMKILDQLGKHKSAKCEELADLLGVSANTIRRDLAVLEEKGLLTRIQGGAIISDIDKMIQPVDLRVNLNEPEKMAIGRAAAKLVKPYSSIIMDAGSTTIAMAQYIGETSGLTVLTNSLDICGRLISNHRISVISSGGLLVEATHSFVGSPAEKFFETTHVEQLFLGTKGVDLDRGLTNSNIQEAPVKKKMIEAADEVILLADHSKFGKAALTHFADIKSIHTLVTDAGIDKSYVDALEAQGIRVIIAPGKE
ncbi:MAG: DeoR/GlpR family DNA-binding transcription regulator [Spirochaetes bacterium]|nr:DeoR/GlpR family DNA-binding transcription regulator [Spirochaetota bacterium]